MEVPIKERIFEDVLEKYLQKANLFWKIASFWDACSGIFTEVNPVLEFLLKVDPSPPGRPVRKICGPELVRLFMYLLS